MAEVLHYYLPVQACTSSIEQLTLKRDRGREIKGGGGDRAREFVVVIEQVSSCTNILFGTDKCNVKEKTCFDYDVLCINIVIPY